MSTSRITRVVTTVNLLQWVRCTRKVRIGWSRKMSLNEMKKIWQRTSAIDQPNIHIWPKTIYGEDCLGE
ncbi:hypothetical protein EPI10_032300 [Gossypium australe]|uniref:Uncharacterized protein n=1 Tax=Gossypium australe TaxID=47621 RepID=A0A5B6X2W3_9ROSI|nr:hypothetical protein EPI10_032300 [Gossypium australe]